MSDYSTEFGFCSFLHVGVVDDGEDEGGECVECLSVKSIGAQRISEEMGPLCLLRLRVS